MRRRDRRQQSDIRPSIPEVPPVLPFVRVVVRAADEVEVTIDGELLVTGPIDRASLGRVLGTIVAEKRVPVRVELTEADGRRFTDIITPVPQRSAFAPPEALVAPVPATAHVSPQTAARSIARWAPPTLHRIEADGFIPGEDVAVAIIVRSCSADPNGVAHALVDATELSESGLGVLVFGFISGTIHRKQVSK